MSSSSLLKVNFLIPSVSCGGIETYVLRFIQFSKDRISITVIVRNKLSGDLLDEFKSSGVKLISMPLGYLNVFKWFKLFRFLCQEKFDVVCDFNANFAGIPVFIAKIAGVKKRIAFYRQGEDLFKKNIFKDLYNNLSKRLVKNYATIILFNSKAGLNFFFPNISIGDSRFRVINNGVDPSMFDKRIDKIQLRESLKIQKEAFIIGHTGRLTPAKNHSTIIKVAKNLIKEDPNIYFILCGSGVEKLTGELLSMGLEGKVKALGYRKDIPELLSIMDLYYFPSLTEGSPNALIEAMMFGLPFIASDIESIREVIPCDADKWLVHPTDVALSCKLILELKKKIELSPGKIWDNSQVHEKFEASKKLIDFINVIEER